MSKHIGLTLRVGAAYDQVEVVSSYGNRVINRSGMLGHEKKSVLRDVQKIRHLNAVAVAG